MTRATTLALLALTTGLAATGCHRNHQQVYRPEAPMVVMYGPYGSAPAYDSRRDQARLDREHARYEREWQRYRRAHARWEEARARAARPAPAQGPGTIIVVLPPGQMPPPQAPVQVPVQQDEGEE